MKGASYLERVFISAPVGYLARFFCRIEGRTYTIDVVCLVQSSAVKYMSI
jgi:hypothetical protein